MKGSSRDSAAAILAEAYTSGPMDPNIVTLAFAVAVLLSLAAKFWLATRHMRHVAAHRDRVPAAFAATVTPEAHRRAADYTLAKGRFGLLATAFGTLVLLGWTLLGGLDLLNQALLESVQPRFGSMAYQLATCPSISSAPSASSSASASTA
jgi:STE24 endopeptidase